MKTILITLLFTVILVSAASGLEPEADEYPCHFLREAPRLEENDEKIWSGLPWQSGFLIYRDDRTHGYAAEKPTSFKAGWTKDSLYLLVKCYDTAPGRLKKSDSVWVNSIELFFPYFGEGENYVQLVVNVAGRQWSGINQSGSREAEWTVKTGIAADAWTAGIKIPFKTIGMTPVEGEKWRVNIARNSVSETEHFTCWPPLGKDGFHDTAHFGKFVFSGTAGVAAISRESVILNSRYRAFLSATIEAAESRYGLVAATIKAGMKYRSLQRKAMLLKTTNQATAELATGKSSPLEIMTIFLMKRNQLEKLITEFKAEIQLEELKIQLEELLAKYSKPEEA